MISLMMAVWVTKSDQLFFNIVEFGLKTDCKVGLFGMNLKKNKQDFRQVLNLVLI